MPWVFRHRAGLTSLALTGLGLLACQPQALDAVVFGGSVDGPDAGVPITACSQTAPRIGPQAPEDDSGPAQIVWPIEVLGAPGTTKTVSFSIDAIRLAATNPTHLWLWVHGADRAGKISVQMGDTPALLLDNQTAEVEGKARAFGGIGGAYSTMAMRVPLSAGALGPGQNTITFAFVASNDQSPGYRVLDFDFVGNANQRLLGRGAFQEDDPQAWRPPASTNAADVAAGAALFQSARLRAGRAADAAPLSVHCGDCHTRDGRDLKFFNYSNAAIVARVGHYGLGELEGNQLAAYIRSLPNENPGRPWNPLFQPGPCLDEQPAYAWSAGAGVQWALQEEQQMQEFLPAGGTSRDALMQGPWLRPINKRTIPLAISLLEWNRWLPRVHPRDAYGQAFVDHDYHKRYLAIRNGLTTGAEDYLYSRFRSDLFDWSSSWSFAGGFAQLAAARGADTEADAERVYSAGLWAAVKQWELMREFSLEEVPRLLEGINAGTRGWFSYRFFSDLPPERFGVNRNLGAGTGLRPGALALAYLVNVWNEVQLIVNPGHRQGQRGGHHTVTWPETSGWFGDLERAGGPQEPLRANLLALKSFDEHDNTVGPEDSWFGWQPKVANAFFARPRSSAWQGIPDAAAVLGTTYQLFMERSARFPLTAWRSLAMNEVAFPSPSYRLGSNDDDRMIPEQMAIAIPRLRTLGVQEALLSGIADFGQMAWPQNDWDKFKIVSDVAAPNNLEATPLPGALSLRWDPVAGAISYNVERSSVLGPTPGPFVTIAYFVPGTSYLDVPLSPGVLHHYRVSANTQTGHGRPGSVVSNAAALGLVSLWRLNERSPTAVTDSTLTQNHGELIGGAARVPGVRANDGAVRLDGKRTFIGMAGGLHPWLTGGSVTFTAVLRTQARTGVLAGNANGCEFGVLNEGTIGVRIKDSRVFSPQPINDGQWHHVAITREPGNGRLRVYVDGAGGTTIDGPEGIFVGQVDRIFSVGRIENAQRFFGGDIDELRLYNQVLSAEQIAALASEAMRP